MALDRIGEVFGETLLAHRERTPFAEIDLLLIGPAPGEGGRDHRWLTLIEVKSWRGELWATDVISRRQRARLERARAYIEAKYARPTRLLLAVVELEAAGSRPGIRYFDAWTSG